MVALHYVLKDSRAVHGRNNVLPAHSCRSRTPAVGHMLEMDPTRERCSSRAEVPVVCWQAHWESWRTRLGIKTPFLSLVVAPGTRTASLRHDPHLQADEVMEHPCSHLSTVMIHGSIPEGIQTSLLSSVTLFARQDGPMSRLIQSKIHLRPFARSRVARHLSLLMAARLEGASSSPMWGCYTYGERW